MNVWERLRMQFCSQNNPRFRRDWFPQAFISNSFPLFNSSALHQAHVVGRDLCRPQPRRWPPLPGNPRQPAEVEEAGGLRTRVPRPTGRGWAGLPGAPAPARGRSPPRGNALGDFRLWVSGSVSAASPAWRAFPRVVNSIRP